MTKTIPMIRTLQHLGATREDITAFIKKAKSKKTSPKILDVCKNFGNTKLKPVLPDDAPIAVVLFAGGGGIETGMVQAGIRPVIAVEFDPSKPELSQAIAKTHHHNFSEYGCRIIQLTVQEVARLGFLGFPRRPDYLHASPVCANFSQAHTAKAGKGGETNDDLSAAIAVAEAIRQLQPRVFTLENVPRYQNSQSFAIILNALELAGYSVTYSVVNMADFGLPQARRRLVLIASRGLSIALPLGTTPCGWYEAIAHLIPTMTDSQLLPKQQQALEKFLAGNAPTPLLIERVGGRSQSKYKPGHLPCNTIVRSHFTDHKGCNRSKFADIWLPDGTVKSLSIEGAAVLQGFPGWYEFPNETATAGSIIGYSVPPSFARHKVSCKERSHEGGYYRVSLHGKDMGDWSELGCWLFFRGYSRNSIGCCCWGWRRWGQAEGGVSCGGEGWVVGFDWETCFQVRFVVYLIVAHLSNLYPHPK